MTGIKRRICAALLAFALVLSCTPSALAEESTTAATMRLMETEGTVGITNSSGRSVSIREKLRLHSGYAVKTEEASYAWINLDDTKLIKQDAVSEVEIRKSGNQLELLLNEGNLFFNVTKRLESDESLNIRTSTMTTGIRGTCGWVKVIDQWTSQLYVLEGTVETSVSDPVTGETKIESIPAGESAVCKVYPQDQEGSKCEIIRNTYPETEIDGFVLTEAVADDGLCDKILDASGLDLRGKAGDAEDRLRQDQASVGEKLAEIETQASLQDSQIATDSVWTAPEPDTAPAAPAVSAKPAAPSASSASSTTSSDRDDDDDDDNNGGGSGGTQPDVPDPPKPSAVTLTMPQDDDTVNHYLSQSTVSSVVLTPGTTRASTASLLEVDSGITVPAGKTLTLQTGVSMEVLRGQTVEAAGTMTVAGGYLECAGTVDVSGQMTVRGDVNFNGTLNVNGRMLVDGYFGGYAAPSGSGEIKARDFSGLHLMAAGWKVSDTKDAAGYYTLVQSQAGDVRWEYDESTGTLRIYGKGPVESIEGCDENTGTAPWDSKKAYIKTVNIENGVTTISGGAFSNCSALTSVKIPNSVTRIREYAFGECSSLASVEIPNSVTRISSYMFKDCGSLTSITIPDGVTSIEHQAFSGCGSLAGITIPDTVTNIGTYAFSGCGSLTSITIPAGVTSIGDCTFSKCGSLASVTIPDSVTNIGRDAFGGCASLQSVTIPGNVTSVGEHAFSYCASLKQVDIPASVTSIGQYAFDGCAALSDVYYGGTEVQWNTLKTKIETGNNYLINAKIHCQGGSGGSEASGTAGENVTWTLSGGTLTISGSGPMEDYTYGTKNAPWYGQTITKVVIKAGVTSIGKAAFQYCRDLTSAEIPDSVTSIGIGAFNGCSKLNNLTIPDKVTSIDAFVFYGCNSLSSVSIPDGVTMIGLEAFESCTSLTSVTIPSSVTSIRSAAFRGCAALTDAHYGGTEAQWNTLKTKIETGNDPLLNATIHYAGSFGTAGANVTWTLSGDTLTISGSGAMKDYSDTDKALWNGQSFTNVVIGSGVTSIGKRAFSGCTSLTSVDIPEGVTSIGDFAFYGCSGLTSVDIPVGVTSIGTQAFSNCFSLTSVNIPSTVTSIDTYAFYSCTALNTVTIPSGITSIEGVMFCGCSSLTSVTIPASVTSIGTTAFSGCTSLTNVYYSGTKTKWDAISIEGSNDPLKKATIHCTDGEIVPTSTSSLSDVSYAAPGYTDVPEGAWYAEAAEYCREKGWMNGTTAATFSPDAPLTRAMMVTVLHRMAGKPPAVEAASFPDVAAGAWCAGAVAWASKEKLVLGFADGTFRPNTPVTRRQAGLIFQRYGGAGVRIGSADAPDGPATRAEIAAALMEFAEGQSLAPGELSVFSAMNIMCGPNGIALDKDGSLLVTDVYNKQIWRVLNRASRNYSGGATVEDLYGRPMGGYNDAGLEESFFKEPWAIAPFLDGWAVSDTANNAVRLIQPDGVQTLNGATKEKLAVTKLGVAFNRPTGLAADEEGNLYVSDTFSGTVRKVTPKGGVSTVVKDLSEPTGLCWKDGALYIAETGANRIVKLQDGKVSFLAGTGQAALADARAAQSSFSSPQGVAVGDDGSVYVADTGNGAVRRIKDGEVTTLAARDMARADFGLTAPVGLLVQGDRLYICDSFARKVFVYQLG